MDELLDLMKENPVNLPRAHEVIANMNTVDIADAFELLDRDKTIQLFRFLPKSVAADVFSYIVPDKQQIIIEALTDAEIGKIINELFADDAADFIEEMPANVVKRVLQNASESKRKLINQLLQYPEDSAGSIMTTEYVDLREDSTVREAFDSIRRTGVNKETIYICYVIRRDRLLLGVVSAKTLMLSKPQDRIGDIMDKNLIFARTTDDQEETAALFRRYGLLSIPVVDKEDRLVGIVTVDDIVQIIEDETTEDFEVMSGITPSEEPYLKTGVLTLARNRIVWLLLLMLSATITGSLIMGFEESLKVVPILYAFIPMLMDTGGNAGSQSATLIIRGIALGEIKFTDIMIVLWREIRVGVLCGVALGAVNFARIFVMYRTDTFEAGNIITISLTVTLSLIATVIISKSVGCMLPLLAKTVKLDPAIMASPLITTIVDAASLIVFFYIARLLLNI